MLHLVVQYQDTRLCYILSYNTKTQGYATSCRTIPTHKVMLHLVVQYQDTRLCYILSYNTKTQGYATSCRTISRHKAMLHLFAVIRHRIVLHHHHIHNALQVVTFNYALQVVTFNYALGAVTIIAGTILAVTFDSVEDLLELWRLQEKKQLSSLFQAVLVDKAMLKALAVKTLTVRVRMWPDELEACQGELLTLATENKRVAIKTRRESH